LPGGAKNSKDEDAANVVAEIVPQRGKQIIPTISGATVGEIFFDALTTAQIVKCRVTPNAGDSIIAASRLANGQPDVVDLGNGDPLQIFSTSAITSIHVCMLANIAVVEAAYDPATKIATGTLVTNTVAADFETAMVEFNFASTDNINLVTIDLTSYSDGTTQDNLGTLKVVGASI